MLIGDVSDYMQKQGYGTANIGVDGSSLVVN